MQRNWSEDSQKNKYLQGVIALLERSQMEKKNNYEITILNRNFDVFPNVFPPSYFCDTEFFVKSMPNVVGKNILEVGCGTGVASVMFALSGALDVVAVDINQQAIINTKHNINKHQVFNKIDCFYSDVFSTIKQEPIFDMVYWNIPFGKVDVPLSILEKSVFDTGYAAISRFFNEAANYLKPDGYILYGFSPTIGDEPALREIIKRADLKTTILAKKAIELKEYPIEFHLCKAIPS